MVGVKILTVHDLLVTKGICLTNPSNIINNIYENHPVEIIENVYMFKIGNDNKVIILDFNDIMKKYMTTDVLPDILYPIITVTKCSLEDSKLSNKCIDKSKCKECVTNNNITGGKKKN